MTLIPSRKETKCCFVFWCHPVTKTPLNRSLIQFPQLQDLLFFQYSELSKQIFFSQTRQWLRVIASRTVPVHIYLKAILGFCNTWRHSKTDILISNAISIVQSIVPPLANPQNKKRCRMKDFRQYNSTFCNQKVFCTEDYRTGCWFYISEGCKKMVSQKLQYEFEQTTKGFNAYMFYE